MVWCLRFDHQDFESALNLSRLLNNLVNKISWPQSGKLSNQSWPMSLFCKFKRIWCESTLKLILWLFQSYFAYFEFILNFLNYLYYILNQYLIDWQGVISNYNFFYGVQLRELNDPMAPCIQFHKFRIQKA